MSRRFSNGEKPASEVMEKCREITSFGKWGRRDSRCHKPATHQIVINGHVTYKGCQRHVERLAGRHAQQPMIKAING